jgi:hypothetical protein
MLPVTTSTYTWQRASNIDEDSEDPLDWATEATGIPGTTSYFSGTESVANGDRERVDCRVFLDTQLDIRHYDRLVDEGTGDTWAIAYTRRRQGLGLDHLVVGAYEVTGVARGTRDL